MNGSTRAGIAALLLVIVWIVVYWRTTPPVADAMIGANTIPNAGSASAPPISRAVPPAQPLLSSSPDFSSSFSTPSTSPTNPATIPTTTAAPQSSPQPAPPTDPRNAERIAQSILARAAQTPPAETKPTPKPGETIPPTFDMYEIQKGDNAQVISQRRYGTTKHWKAILKANPLLDFTRLKPGRVIKVPHDPENTQGIVVEGPATPSTGGAGTATDTVEYTVAPGDTLIGIAKALYGKSSMWEEIRDANPSLDEDGTNLKPGMKLKVPPPTKGAGR